MCGEVSIPSSSLAPEVPLGVSAGELAAMEAEQTRLAAEVADLRSLVERLARELGV